MYPDIYAEYSAVFEIATLLADRLTASLPHIDMRPDTYPQLVSERQFIEDCRDLLAKWEAMS